MEKAENTKQLGSRLDPSLADWIQSKSKELGIKQGEFVARMQRVYIENDITEKYPQWSAQIQDVHFWATSLVDAYVAQVEHGSRADDHARANMHKVLERKDNLIDQQLKDIKGLKEENKRLHDMTKETERLRRDLDSANARIQEMDSDARQRLDDVRTTVDSLMGDKKRLETEIQHYREQLEGMKAAFASYEAIKSERDSALLRIEEERKAAQEMQQQAAASAREEMRSLIDAANEQTQQALIAQAAAQAEANSLREIRDANNELHETIGAQRVQISMLERQVTDLENRCDAQAQQIQELTTKE